MKKLLITALFSVLTTFAMAQEWTLVYQNDAEGNTVTGSIEALKAAVRDGLPVRVGWSFFHPTDKKISVEHVADAKFLTIMSGEIVFAQIDPIIGQTPKFEEGFIELKENISWVMVVGTNGKSDSIMRNVITGEMVGHNARPRAADWYVLR